MEESAMSQIDSMQKQWFGLRNTEMGFYTQMTNSNLGKKTMKGSQERR